ncbi:hypothetical protein OBBRIDRAFT_789933 [Obba rivulosa]|uniref:Uncharacterized protein n=1 Tax=Obba rivulosa TaxID=1052685 RepID=A0A8E2DQ46_9APHY|nr:hypothetical protein OBBRIDRAFT_789933 [Obba rivulosa]
MHRCLRILDTYLAILRVLREDVDIEGLAALAVLARTCHVLSEPALDVLWEEPHCFADLVRCLPEDTWVLYETLGRPCLTVNKPLGPSDWTRFNFYAPRVRRLTFPNVYITKYMLIDTQTLSLLSEHRPSLLLLPHLRSVGFMGLPESFWSFIQLFTGPELTEFRWECIMESSLRQAAISVLTNLVHRSPNIVTLSVRVWQDGRVEPSILPLTLESLRHLRNVSLIMPTAHEHPADLFRWLTSLSSLSYLGLSIHGSLPDVEDASGSPYIPFARKVQCLAPSFRALETFRVDDAAIQTASATLPFLSRSPRLRNLSLSLFLGCVGHLDDPQDDGAVVRDLLQAISRHCPFEHIETFAIEILCIDAGDKYTLGIDQIAFLLAFRNLEHVILHLDIPIDLEDVELERLVKAWPFLRTLHIGNPEEFTVARFMPRLTYDALVVLATHSPQRKASRSFWTCAPSRWTMCGEHKESVWR